MKKLCLFLCLILLSVTPALADSQETKDCPRIISQSPYLTLALEWLGRGSCIVGVSRYDTRRPELPRTGGVLDPDREAIAALHPDLLVSSNWASLEVMEDVTPPGARFVRLDGFASLVDVEDMLRSLAAESRADGAEARIGEFSRRWREMAEQLARQHRGKRLLVLSTCMGAPFSFGRRHVIGDLFAQAGFQVVETAPKIRHVLPGEEIPDLNTLIAATRPEIVVALTSESADFCHMAAPNVDIRVVPLDGRHFIHPGPGLLEAYEAMRSAFGQAETGTSSP